VIQEHEARRKGFIERDGARVHYQVFGAGPRALLLLPTFTIVHSGFWARQITHFTQRYTVIAFDAPGNGASDRPAGPEAYSDWKVASDAVAVMDTVGAETAAAVSLSGGAVYGLILAANHPGRVPASVFIAPGLPVTPSYPERVVAQAVFEEPQPEYTEWGKWNRHYWQQDWQGFLEFFSAKCFSEPGPAADIRRWVQMGLETTPEVILTALEAPGPDVDEIRQLIDSLKTPVLFVHGSEDEVIPLARSEELARLTGGELVVIEGSGHEPQYRQAERLNAALDQFLAEHYPPAA
jgi:pimeloyl-ACP methyl ester carboxylesterase